MKAEFSLVQEISAFFSPSGIKRLAVKRGSPRLNQTIDRYFMKNHMMEEFKPQNTPNTQKGRNVSGPFAACFAWSAVKRPSVSASTEQALPAEYRWITVDNGDGLERLK